MVYTGGIRMKDDGKVTRTAPGVFGWRLLRKALKAAEEGVYCWNLTNNQIYYTEQCMHMLGMPIHDIAPNIFTEADICIHEEDRKFFLSTVQHYIDRPTMNPLRVEVRLLNQNSRGWRWVRVNGLLEKNAEDGSDCLVGVWVDITRRKMADWHAMEERDLFRTLINHLPDNIYFKSRESRFVIANEATARKMGVPTPADLIGCRDDNFFSGEMSDIARREELQIMQTGKPITNRIHHETWKGGADSWSRVSKFPWYDSAGRIKGIVGISSDVTELIESRHRYQRAAEELRERTDVLENEISLAREIQLALQPRSIPDRICVRKDGKTSRAHFHHVYMPCDGVAGDCYAVFPVGDSGLGMLICDVMGHGVHAALIVSMLRGLTEQVANLADTPGLLLNSLNYQLNRIFTQANISMFASAFYVYLDLERKRLTLSGAGHPAPIIITADGKAHQPVIPRSPALGLLPHTNFRESEQKLEPGMKLMLFTDGLTEARDTNGDELGVDRLLRILQDNPPDGIKQVIETSLNAMHSYAGKPGQDDDICLLGVEFTEE